MIKHLVQHGNSKALVIEKSLLQSAGLNENVAFQISVTPHGLIIQNIMEEASLEEVKEKGDKLLKSRKKLWKDLSNK